MGYYVSIQDCDFLIPKENEDAALLRLKMLNSRDDLKSGGQWGDGAKTKSWFSWMPPDYDKTVNTVGEVLGLLGFELQENEDGTRITYYDSKTGQEQLFLETVAPYVRPGSYIIWRGEDGAMEKWEFNGKDMKTLIGNVVFE